VHNYPPMLPEEFIKDSGRDFQRRLVATFWDMVAWMVLAEFVDSKLIRLRFEQAMLESWEKLRPLEIAKRLEIEKVEHGDWTEEQRRAMAAYRVDNIPLGKLCNQMIREAAQTITPNEDIV